MFRFFRCKTPFLKLLQWKTVVCSSNRRLERDDYWFVKICAGIYVFRASVCSRECVWYILSTVVSPPSSPFITSYFSLDVHLRVPGSSQCRPSICGFTRFCRRCCNSGLLTFVYFYINILCLVLWSTPSDLKQSFSDVL